MFKKRTLRRFSPGEKHVCAIKKIYVKQYKYLENGLKIEKQG
jgi:hypothetical protein